MSVVLFLIGIALWPLSSSCDAPSTHGIAADVQSTFESQWPTIFKEFAKDSGEGSDYVIRRAGTPLLRSTGVHCQKRALYYVTDQDFDVILPGDQAGTRGAFSGSCGMDVLILSYDDKTRKFKTVFHDCIYNVSFANTTDQDRKQDCPSIPALVRNIHPSKYKENEVRTNLVFRNGRYHLVDPLK
jgi:hypothetical protein